MAGKAISELRGVGNKSIQQSALCGLGQTAPNPVLSTIKYFRHSMKPTLRIRSVKLPYVPRCLMLLARTLVLPMLMFLYMWI